MSRHKWTPNEDAALVSCMVDLHQQGHRNCDSGFKMSFMADLEKMMDIKLPGSGLKARPHIESRLKMLKSNWMVVYDMINGKNTSGFGWDETKHVIVAEDAVWNDYIKAHKEVAPFRNKNFPHFDDLTRIYAKDRATDSTSQTVQEVLRAAEAEATEDHLEDNNTEASDAHGGYTWGSENNVCASKKRRRKDDEFDTLRNDMKELGKLLLTSTSMSVTDLIMEKLLILDAAIRSLEGITEEEVQKTHD